MKKLVLLVCLLAIFTLSACEFDSASLGLPEIELPSFVEDLIGKDDVSDDANNDDTQNGEDTPHVHEYTWTVKQHVKCNVDGIEIGTCECGETTSRVVEATGHSFVVDPAVEADCENTGLTEGQHCEKCGHVEVAQEVVPYLHGEAVVDAAVAATCTETGLTEGSHCSLCEAVLVAQEVTPALGHNPSAEFQHDESGHWHKCLNNCGEPLEYSDHAYNQKVAREDYISTYATAESPALFFMSCECGVKGTETFEYMKSIYADDFESGTTNVLPGAHYGQVSPEIGNGNSQITNNAEYVIDGSYSYELISASEWLKIAGVRFAEKSVTNDYTISFKYKFVGDNPSVVGIIADGDSMSRMTFGPNGAAGDNWNLGGIANVTYIKDLGNGVFELVTYVGAWTGEDMYFSFYGSNGCHLIIDDLKIHVGNALSEYDTHTHEYNQKVAYSENFGEVF